METVLRVGFIYLLLLVLLRLLGKRELSQLSPLELVMLLLIPELVAQGIVGDDFSMTNALVALATLLSLVFVTSAFAYRFPRIGELVEGKPAVLAAAGRLVGETMDRERISIEEFSSEMRQLGIERLDQVKWAVLETSGRIAIIAEPPVRRAAETEVR